MIHNHAYAQLIELLQSDGPEGLIQLERTIGDSLRLVIRNFQNRGLLSDDTPEKVLRCALAGLRITLRRADAACAPSDSELESYLLAIAIRILGPHAVMPQIETPSASTVLSFGFGYTVAGWSQPLVGVGGDLHRVNQVADGLLLLLADVTGHSRAAHALARGLERLWDDYLAQPRGSLDPSNLADRIDAELAACLPEGMFVEAAIVRATPSGLVTIVAAGGVRYVHATSSLQTPTLGSVAGFWLGLGVTGGRDQVRVELDSAGGEIVLGTDGLFDQPGLTGASVWEALPDTWSTVRPACLHDTVLATYRAAITNKPQLDDTTIVSLRRVGPVETEVACR